MSRYLDSGGHYPEAAAIHGHASRAARLSGDSAAEATSLTSLGLTHFRQGRYRQAATYLQQALALFRDLDSLLGQAEALNRLGELSSRTSAISQAWRPGGNASTRSTSGPKTSRIVRTNSGDPPRA